MLRFQNKYYQLFFSNNLEPLRALNYADEFFFDEFERFCGSRYRIISIIRNGWQEKYCLQEDIDSLKKHFLSKIDQEGWDNSILSEYEKKKEILTKTLFEESTRNYSEATNIDLATTLSKIRVQSVTLDAMSNMLHLLSSLIGGDFIVRLKNYSNNSDAINQNFIFYTQPVKESKYAELASKEFIGKFTLSKNDQNLSNILRIGVYIKNDTSTLLEERGTKLMGLFREIGQRISITPSDLYYLTIEEIRNILEKNKNVSTLIKKRKSVTILFYPNTSLKIYEGEDAEIFLKKGKFSQIIAKPEKQDELKGQVASLGKVSGRAVVVKNSNEAIKLIGEGDVLVAPYTAPEYLPAMKKAAAIVTETGGITSHAAIVSRELKIPCVIGVTDAVSILRTGDRIEVDGDKGIIKIIK